jgi:predicted esterase
VNSIAVHERDTMPRTTRITALPLLVLLTLLAATTVVAGPLEDFEQAMLAGRYEQAAGLARELAKKHPKSSVAAYNVGCALSRTGEIDSSISWLKRSAELGFAGVRSIAHDDDLDAVRSHEGFAGVRAAVEANAAARFAQFRAAAEEAEPVITLPPNFDPTVPTPLLIVLHGTGGNGAGMTRAWAKPAAAAGAILVAPDALRPVRDTDGYSWVFRDEAEWLVLRTIERARERWNVGPVILAGFSQGANIAIMLGQTHPDHFAAIIPVSGHYEADVAELPAEGRRPRWFLIIGALDPWAKTYDEAQRAFEAAGMTVRLRRIPEQRHAMPKGERGERLLQEAIAWAVAGVP